MKGNVSLQQKLRQILPSIPAQIHTIFAYTGYEDWFSSGSKDRLEVKTVGDRPLHAYSFRFVEQSLLSLGAP